MSLSDAKPSEEIVAVLHDSLPHGGSTSWLNWINHSLKKVIQIAVVQIAVIQVTVIIGGLILSSCTVNPTPPEDKPNAPPVVENLPTALTGSWLLVDTRRDTLTVMHDDKPVETFKNIALGSSGAGIKQRRGDAKTPLGRFRIGWINDKSRFRRFFGLDYPNLDYAERGYRDGLIDTRTYQQIRTDLAAGRTPPQTTKLGGQIGIHGVGAGDPFVHSRFDWTDGCIALDNRQIDQLAQWIRIGMPVEIR